MNAKFQAAFFVAIRKGNAIKVKAMLAEGADPNWRDQYDLTALIWSARRGHFDVFRELVSAGADLTAVDITKRTFLHHCVLFHRESFLNESLKIPNVPIDAQDVHGWTALDVAIAQNGLERAFAKNDRSCIELLKQAGAKHNRRGLE